MWPNGSLLCSDPDGARACGDVAQLFRVAGTTKTGLLQHCSGQERRAGQRTLGERRPQAKCE